MRQLKAKIAVRAKIKNSQENYSVRTLLHSMKTVDLAQNMSISVPWTWIKPTNQCKLNENMTGNNPNIDRNTFILYLDICGEVCHTWDNYFFI